MMQPRALPSLRKKGRSGRAGRWNAGRWGRELAGLFTAPLATIMVPAALLAGSLPGDNCVMPPLPEEWVPEGRRAVSPGPRLRAVPQLPPLRPDLAPRFAPAAGEGFVPAILVDFSDKPHAKDPLELEERLFAPLPARSVRTYYLENSYGQYELTGEVLGWFRARNTKLHYTNYAYGFDTGPGARVEPYHKNVWGLLEDVVELADATVDFSRFDNDGPDGLPDSGDDDGVVDALVLIASGRGAEDWGSSTSDFWSHKFDLRQCVQHDYCPFAPDGLGTEDGVVIGPYMVVPEVGQIGVACHEYGHILGLPDIYYFAQGTGDDVSPLGVFCLMDMGAWMDDPDDPAWQPGCLPSHFCGWSKYTLGWVDPPAVSEDTRTPFRFGVSIPPMAEGDEAEPGIFRLLDNPGGADWDRSGYGEGRYFLLENRQRSGFDRGLWGPNALAGDGGLLITFVNEYVRGSGPDPLVYVVQADGQGLEADGDLPGLGEASDLWPGVGHSADTFNEDTVDPRGIFDGELAQVTVDRISVGPGGWVDFNARLSGAGMAGGLPARAWPNPADAPATVVISYLPPSGDPTGLRVSLFSLAGERVRVLDEAPEVDPSLARAYWNLRDDEGNAVASGLYLFVVEAGGTSAGGAVTVRR